MPGACVRAMHGSIDGLPGVPALPAARRGALREPTRIPSQDQTGSAHSLPHTLGFISSLSSWGSAIAIPTAGTRITISLPPRALSPTAPVPSPSANIRRARTRRAALSVSLPTLSACLSGTAREPLWCRPPPKTPANERSPHCGGHPPRGGLKTGWGPAYRSSANPAQKTRDREKPNRAKKRHPPRGYSCSPGVGLSLPHTRTRRSPPQHAHGPVAVARESRTQ